MAPQFTYTPGSNVAKAPNTPSTPIVIHPVNVAFSPSIPEKFKGVGFEEFALFLSRCPLRHALEDVANPFFPQHVCEFYFSCSYDTETKTIGGTIGNGGSFINVSVQTVRQALRLPQLSRYSATPDEAMCKSVLPSIGYDTTLQGARDGSKFVLRQCFPAGWKYLTGVIGRCLGHKNSSLDQLNLFELRLLFAIVKNKRLDFAQIIFDQFVDLIGGKSRPSYVPFPRWFALILQHNGTGYASGFGDSIASSFLSPKLINAAPKDGDVHITKGMNKWIQNPYNAESNPDSITADDNLSSSSDTEQIPSASSSQKTEVREDSIDSEDVSEDPSSSPSPVNTSVTASKPNQNTYFPSSSSKV